MWTFDRGLPRRVRDSTAEARSVRGATGGTVRFLRGEPLALLDSPRPEWRDVARHPLGGGGIEDLLTGKQAGSAPTTTPSPHPHRPAWVPTRPRRLAHWPQSQPQPAL